MSARRSSKFEWREMDRVVITGPPPDVIGTGRGEDLWTGKIGTIVNGPHQYMDQDCYKVRLDEDLVEAANYGWIENNFIIASTEITALVPDPDEVDEAVSSIQTTIQNRQARR